jgi:predicted double-glycine peptidase
MRKASRAREILRVAQEVLIKPDEVGAMLKVPDLRQGFDYDCGVKSTQTVLAYYGIDERADHLEEQLKTGEEGTYATEIVRVLKEHGLQVVDGTMTIDSLKEALLAGFPVIVSLQAWADDENTDYTKTNKEGHFVVAIGFNGNKVYFEDPSTFGKVYLTFDELLERWHEIEDEREYNQYGIVVKGDKKYDDWKAVRMGREDAK